MTDMQVVMMLVGLLAALIGWVGNRMSSKIDDIPVKVDEKLSKLHDKVNGVTERVASIETACDIRHGVVPDRRHQVGAH